MKRIAFICIFAGFFQLPTLADVIYSPLTNIGAALSLELIGSYEIHFTKYNTINFWGGAGMVSPINKLINPALGTEAAIEIRHYFKSNSFKNLNLGIYAGLAYMRHPLFYNNVTYENSTGFIPGIKLTYKKRINSWLVGEPYISISTPWYTDNFNRLSDFMAHNEPGFIVTAGLRFGFNKVNKIKAKV
jgi:hypothetical protein